MIKETLELSKRTRKIDVSLESIVRCLMEIMSDNRRHLTIDYRGLRFVTEEPLNEKDKKRIVREQKRIIKKMLLDCVKKSVEEAMHFDVKYRPNLEDIFTPDAWAPIQMFYGLSNPDDFKCERIKAEDVYEVGDSKYGSRRPLNKDNYYVMQQVLSEEEKMNYLDDDGNQKPMIWDGENWIVDERSLECSKE